MHIAKHRDAIERIVISRDTGACNEDRYASVIHSTSDIVYVKRMVTQDVESGGKQETNHRPNEEKG